MEKVNPLGALRPFWAVGTQRSKCRPLAWLAQEPFTREPTVQARLPGCLSRPCASRFADPGTAGCGARVGPMRTPSHSALAYGFLRQAQRLHRAQREALEQ